MPNPNIADLVTELQTRVQSIAGLQGKLVFVYNNDDAASKLKGLGGTQWPAVALVYEGMHSVGGDGPSGARGLSCEAVFSIIIVQQAEGNFNVDRKSIVIDLLSQLRSMLAGSRSVTSHFWKFLVEAPAELENGLAFWVQRWSVPVQIKPDSSI